MNFMSSTHNRIEELQPHPLPMGWDMEIPRNLLDEKVTEQLTSFSNWILHFLNFRLVYDCYTIAMWTVAVTVVLVASVKDSSIGWLGWRVRWWFRGWWRWFGFRCIGRFGLFWFFCFFLRFYFFFWFFYFSFFCFCFFCFFCFLRL